MINHMVIRDATAADIDAIARLLADDGLGRGRETPGDPAYARAFAAMSAQPGNGILRGCQNRRRPCQAVARQARR